MNRLSYGEKKEKVAWSTHGCQCFELCYDDITVCRSRCHLFIVLNALYSVMRPTKMSFKVGESWKLFTENSWVISVAPAFVICLQTASGSHFVSWLENREMSRRLRLCLLLHCVVAVVVCALLFRWVVLPCRAYKCETGRQMFRFWGGEQKKKGLGSCRICVRPRFAALVCIFILGFLVSFRF